MWENVAIIGAGLIGRSWAIVFARAGHRVAIWDRDAARHSKRAGRD
jgi:3-hydroxyacyl-CoA dehydrogenase